MKSLGEKLKAIIKGQRIAYSYQLADGSSQKKIKAKSSGCEKDTLWMAQNDQIYNPEQRFTLY